MAGKKAKTKQRTEFWNSPWSVRSFLRECDIFGRPIPAFNIKGKDKVKTAIGGILSAMIMTITLGYTIMNFYDLILKTNPIVSQNSIKNYFGRDYVFELKDSNQIFAFAIVGTDGKPKYDTRYFRIMAINDVKTEDGKWHFVDRPLRDCTE